MGERCAQVSVRHSSTGPSAQPQAPHVPAPPPPRTCPLCPRRRYSPASPATSHTTTSVSLEPEASRAPPRLKRSADTSLRWPLKVAAHSPLSRSHSRTCGGAREGGKEGGREGGMTCQQTRPLVVWPCNGAAQASRRHPPGHPHRSVCVAHGHLVGGGGGRYLRHLPRRLARLRDGWGQGLGLRRASQAHTGGQASACICSGDARGGGRTPHAPQPPCRPPGSQCRCCISQHSPPPPA